MALTLEPTVEKMDKLVAKLGEALITKQCDLLRLPEILIAGEYRVVNSALKAAVKRYNIVLVVGGDGDTRELIVTLKKNQGKVHCSLVAEYADALDRMLDEALEDAIYSNHSDTVEVVLNDKELELAREQLMSAFYVLDASPTEVVASHYVYNVGLLLEENTRQDSIETLLVTFEIEAREHYLSMNQKPLGDIMPILVMYKDGQRLVKFTPPDEVDNYVKAENVSAVVGADKRPEGSDGTATAA